MNTRNFIVILCIICTYGNYIDILEYIENEGLRQKLLSEALNYINGYYNDLVVDSNSNSELSVQNQATNLDKGTPFQWSLNVVQLIKWHGYPVETHSVITKDDYILSIQRIPQNNNNYYQKNQAPVVLIMPGILCSSADWVVIGPGKALPYLLSDEGYDVWLGNPRGTTLSRKHVYLNPDIDKDFWDFSFHEMGVFDLPAIIDYILQETEQSDLYYIAHSQGATSFFVMASVLPEYNKKIRLISALAPVIYNNHIKNPFLKIILPYLDKLKMLTDIINMYEFLPHSSLMTFMGRTYCNDDAPTQSICPLILFLGTGFDEPQLNRTMLPVLFSNFPAGSSLKQIWHFGQELRSGKFQQYDYGPEKNWNAYGQSTPPQYDLKKVTVPVAVYYSTNDWIASDMDARRLVSVLPNVIRDHLVRYSKFNHLDYIWAKDVKTMIYDYIIEDMKKF